MITNKSKKKIICDNEKILTSIFSKAVGLMFHKRITDTGYIFVFEKPRRIDLHMFFVFFPIDLLFLDKEKKVIEIKEDFRPFTLYYSKEKAAYVIELPPKSINNSNCEKGDIIAF
jgi:uncharacterized protein